MAVRPNSETHDTAPAISYCPQCAQEQDSAQSENEQDDEKTKRVALKKQRLASLHIGRRFAGKSFDDFRPPCPKAKEYLKTCRAFAATFTDRLNGGDCLLMIGDPGTGKSHLAAAVGQEVAKQGFHALHTTARKIVRRVRKTWNAKTDEQAAIDEFLKPQLLIINEGSRLEGSASDITLLAEVIDSRYDDMLPTILIANMDEAQLAKFIGPEIIDRFYEGKSSIMVFDWKSWRRNPSASQFHGA